MKKIIVLAVSILILGCIFSSCADKENKSKNVVNEENLDVENTNTETTVIEEKIIQVETTEEMQETVETEMMVETEEIVEEMKETTAEEVANDMLEKEAAEAMEEASGSKLPKISFTSTKFEAEPVKQGTLITHDYEFENTGEAPLIIESVKPSCGCMTVSFPKEVIAPGHKGKIRVTFDSKGKEGIQRKSVTVKANTIPNVHVLSFFTEILIK